MKKRRVNDNMEISAIETLANAKLEVGRALHTANKTLHRLLDECPHEFEAITKSAELNSIKDKRVYTEMYESEADAKIISGKWVLKPHKARYVLRGTKTSSFASTTMTASVRMVLSQATDLISEVYAVFTADVKTAFLNAHMKDGDVVFARPPTEWQPETLHTSKGTVIWKLQKSLYGLRSVFHVGDLMLTGTRENISEVVAELRRDLEIKSNDVTTKPTRYLGRTLVKTEEEYNFGVVASYVENMLEEFNKTALKSSQTLRWERRETGEQELPASQQKVYRQLVGKWLCIDRVDLRCAMGKASSSLGRASDTDMRNVKSAIPPWKPWNHDSAADETQPGSCEKSSCGLSVDVPRLRLRWRR